MIATARRKIAPQFLGVDVAKPTLAIQFPDQLWSTANIAQGHAAFLAKARALGAVHVICEATGGYERALVATLHRAGIAVSVINPRQVRDFARACGRLAKTDAIDASVLRDYGEKLRPAPDSPPAEGANEFADLVRARQDLVGLITDALNRREHARLPALVKLSLARQKQLEKQFATLDALLDTHVIAHAALVAKAERLQQVAGVGRVSALTVLALLPDLDCIGDAQASALVGVAPLNHNIGQFRASGTSTAAAPPSAASSTLAALAATQHNPILETFYLRLR